MTHGLGWGHVEAIAERTGGEAFSARDRDLSRKIAERLAVLRGGSSGLPSHYRGELCQPRLT